MATRAHRRSPDSPHPLCRSPVRSVSPKPQYRGHARPTPAPRTRSTSSKAITPSVPGPTPHPPRQLERKSLDKLRPAWSRAPPASKEPSALLSGARRLHRLVRLGRGGAGRVSPSRKGHPVSLRVRASLRASSLGSECPPRRSREPRARPRGSSAGSGAWRPRRDAPASLPTAVGTGGAGSALTWQQGPALSTVAPLRARRR